MALLGVGRDTLYKVIRSGRLPARKIGRRTLILAADLERFLSSLPVMGAA
jgi:excisionase family DNA binding protein